MLMCFSPILESEGKYIGKNCAASVAYIYHILAVRLEAVAAFAQFNARLFQDSNTLLFFHQAKYPAIFPFPIQRHLLERKPIISHPLETVQAWKVGSSSLNFCYLFFFNFYYFCMFPLTEQSNGFIDTAIKSLYRSLQVGFFFFNIEPSYSNCINSDDLVISCQRNRRSVC